jgi:fructosamine-3-kinase
LRCAARFRARAHGECVHDRLERLRDSLARVLNETGVQVAPYREGVDCWVDLVTRPSEAPACVRSAKFERLETRYDGIVDFGEVLEKELVVSRLLREANIPTPEILAWHRADSGRDRSWMLVEYVAHVPTEILSEQSERELGILARRIHAIRPRADQAARLAPGKLWDRWITRRILARVDAARRFMPVPSFDRLEQAIGEALRDRSTGHDSLMHLDLRAPNLAIANHRITAVFDLSNALVGDPYLELARIRGYGLLTPNFLAGYGIAQPEFERNRRLLDVYELDVTALLVVVSREEFDDPDLHLRMVERSAALFDLAIRP